MFKMSKQVDYALQLLSALGQIEMGTVLSLKEFSKESTISFLFLQRIARLLRTAGLIVASRGSIGGYSLVKPIDQIMIREVVEAVEGKVGLAVCQIKEKLCPKATDCKIKKGVHSMNQKMLDLIGSVSVADLLNETE